MNRTLPLGATAIALSLTGLTLAATPAHAATSGTGWQILTQRGITHLDNKPWTITYYDSTSRTKLGPNITKTLAELKKHTGLTFTQASKNATYTGGQCVTGHRIILRYTATPTKTSSAKACANSSGATDGAYVNVDSTDWNTRRYTGKLNTQPIYQAHTISHEMGHALGLDHPATCPFTGGTKPVMCPGGGYNTTTKASLYTPYDIAGLKALRSNS